MNLLNHVIAVYIRTCNVMGACISRMSCHLVSEVHRVTETNEARKVRESNKVTEPNEVRESNESNEVRKVTETNEVREVRESNEVRDTRDVLLSSIYPEHIKAYLLEHIERSALSGNVAHLENAFDFRQTLEEHADVTVMFCDICGFTRMSIDERPSDVARFLHAVYLRIDMAIEKYPSIRKIETIGDCIVLAEGLYGSNGNCMMAFAKEVIRTVATLCHKGEPVEMRIGIHVGPVASGVVGIRAPRFCLFGNTVNTASRLQTSARPGEIHMSAEFAERIERHEGRSEGSHGSRASSSTQVVCNGDVDLKGMGRKKTFSGICGNHCEDRVQCTEILRVLFHEEGVSMGETHAA